MGNGVLLELQGIRKTYNREVLHVDHLVFKKGLIYGIIGPSGAGKSTLLRIINLLTPPCEGSYRYEGSPLPRNMKKLLDLQRKMSFVFQKNVLFKDSVWNNVAFGLKARGYSKSEINERVSSLLDQVGLAALSRRRADTLSGGEAQRVAIARAVAFEPELLLLDEPTANLDPLNVELIEKMICAMNRESSITMVMVTHNGFQARRIANEVIFINEGKVVETGPAGKIFSEPEQEATRLFVEGRMIF